MTELAPEPIWNILCPGPSLANVRLGEDRKYPTVAVNAAIGHPEGADYWCVQDEVDIPWHERYRDLVLQQGTEIWCLAKHLDDWKEWAGESCKVAPNPLSYWEVKRTPSWIVQFWFMPLRSSFAAVTRCICRGANEIRLFGCDMTGEASYHGDTGEEMEYGPREDGWWEDRWKTENLYMAAMIEQCAKNGVEVSLREYVKAGGAEE